MVCIKLPKPLWFSNYGDGNLIWVLPINELNNPIIVLVLNYLSSFFAINNTSLHFIFVCSCLQRSQTLDLNFLMPSVFAKAICVCSACSNSCTILTFSAHYWLRLRRLLLLISSCVSTTCVSWVDDDDISVNTVNIIAHRFQNQIIQSHELFFWKARKNCWSCFKFWNIISEEWEFQICCINNSTTNKNTDQQCVKFISFFQSQYSTST